MSRHSDVKRSTSQEFFNKLQAGIDQIFAKGNPHGMKAPQYMNLYSAVYNYLTASSATFVHSHNAGNESEQFGGTLYKYLKSYLSTYLKDLSSDGLDSADDDLLSFYTKSWSNYRFSSEVLSGICSYLDRFWVPTQQTSGKPDIYKVYHLALVVWRDVFFKRVGDRLTNAILALIKKEREGVTIRTHLVSEVLSCYVELGSVNTRENLELYRRKFEDVFIEETKDFYATESNDFLLHHSFVDYMRRIELRLIEEEKRLRSYLNKDTWQRLKQVCEDVLINRQIEKFHQEFQSLLNIEKHENLAIIYNLVSRIPGGYIKLKAILEDHITKQGLAKIEKCGEAVTQDPELFVATILEVYNYFEELVKNSFNGDPNFIMSIDKACESFINTNYVTRVTGSSSRPAELMAKYCDSLLKKSSKNPEELEVEEKLRQVVIVFRYLSDKDVFQKFYTKLFGRRLIQSLSSSDDAEMSMISKLKEACGFEYTSKLQRMYQDITNVSKEQNEKFKQYLAKEGEAFKFDMYVQILTSGSWPMQPNAHNNIALPPALKTGVDMFEKFYHSNFSGRKLTWLTQSSKGELHGCFNNQNYIFTASTTQIAILLQYNHADSYKVKEIASKVKIDIDHLKQILALLIRVKLLQTENSDIGEDEASAQDGRDAIESRLNQETVISIFLGYKNKKLRININVPLKAEVKQEQEKTYKHIEEDRKMLIQATIVRIMKTRRTLNHQNLMAEVLVQLSQRFHPSVPIIKKCIDILIEKEYLKRDQSCRDTYVYVA